MNLNSPKTSYNLKFCYAKDSWFKNKTLFYVPKNTNLVKQMVDKLSGIQLFKVQLNMKYVSNANVRTGSYNTNLTNMKQWRKTKSTKHHF